MPRKAAQNLGSFTGQAGNEARDEMENGDPVWVIAQNGWRRRSSQ